MNAILLRSLVKVAIYEKKADTATSYYHQSGDETLPNRLSISMGNTLTYAANKGRLLTEAVVGQITAQFKKEENSPLKQFKPYKLQSRIFLKAEFPQLAGYGTIAVSDAEGHITSESEEGVLVFNRIGKDLIQLFFVAGQCTPDLIMALCEYVAELIENGKDFTPSQVGF